MYATSHDFTRPPQSAISMNVIVCMAAFATCVGATIAGQPDYIHPRNSLYRLDDKYCGAYVAWHALRHYGLNRPIDTIVKEMDFNNGAVTIRELARYLDAHGLSTRIVKLDRNKVGSVPTAFVVLFRAQESVGHFVFCIPGQHGFLNCDGPRIDWVDINVCRTVGADVWDGTCILVSKSSAWKSTIHGGLILALCVLLAVSFRSIRTRLIPTRESRKEVHTDDGHSMIQSQ